MAWEWLPMATSIVFGILETTATLGIGAACPPLAPVVGAAFQIGGTLVNEASTHAMTQLQGQDKGNTGQQLAYPTPLYDEQLVELRNIVSENQEYLKENQELLMGIQGMINSTFNENKQMMKEMRESLKSFEDNMEKNFDELKGFITEINFITDTRAPIKVLWNALEASSADPVSKYKKEKFLETYKKHTSAKALLHTFVGKLSYDQTNPVKKAMENRVLDSRQILKQYMNIISNLVVKVIAIEGFYHGLTNITKKNPPKYLDDFSEDMSTAIENIRQKLNKIEIPIERYWPILVNETVIESNDGSAEVDVADHLENQLNGIHTNDIFTIFVFHCDEAESCTSTPLEYPEGELQLPGNFYAERIMVEHVNVETNVRTVVLRSGNRHNSTANTATLHTSFRAFMSMRYQLQYDECNEKSRNTFVNSWSNLFASEDLPYGFIACNPTGPIEQRLTNKAEPILTQNERGIIENDRFYYGLSWI